MTAACAASAVRLARWHPGVDDEIWDDVAPEDADLIAVPWFPIASGADPGSISLAIGGLLDLLPHYKAFPDKHLLLNNNDLDAIEPRPQGHLFQVSASYRTPDILPLHYNVLDPGVPSPISDARCDVFFQGAITTSPVRQAMNLWRHGWADWRISFQAVDPYWTLPSAAQAALRRSYNQGLINCRFVLCPRGRGLNSRRFFEALAFGRIPILFADAARLPLEQTLPWERFTVRVPEGFGRWTPDFVARFLVANDLDEASRLARAVWVEYFAPAKLRRFLVASLREAGTLPHRPRPDVAQLSGVHLRHLRAVPCRDDMYDLLPKDAVVAELGVAYGHNARSILDRARPRILHLVDLWPDRRADCYRTVQQEFSVPIGEGRVALHRGDDLEILREFPDSYFDWVYLDSSHQYLHTRQELALLERKLKPEGILCGHDYVDYDVRLQGSGEHAWYRLKQCVNEFCIRNQWEFVYLTMEYSSNPSFAIRRMRR